MDRVSFTLGINMLIVLEDSLKNRDSCFVGDSRDGGLVSRSLIALYLLLTQQGRSFRPLNSSTTG